jgi:hypothetical protein
MYDRFQAERFLRAATTVSVITFIPMCVAVGLGYLSLLPAVIASIGVIASFGVHLNRLLEVHGTLVVNLARDAQAIPTVDAQ